MVGYFSETVIAYWILWSHCELGQEGFYDTRFQCHVMQRVSVAKGRNLRTLRMKSRLECLGSCGMIKNCCCLIWNRLKTDCSRLHNILLSLVTNYVYYVPANSRVKCWVNFKSSSCNIRSFTGRKYYLTLPFTMITQNL